jgi:hypothetical protein
MEPRGSAASFAERRAWELLPTPNAHPSQRERDESEARVRLLDAPEGVHQAVSTCRELDSHQELF